ncbi:MAG: phosphatidylserine decarboxylase family protein [Bacteroidales bacterium]|nr:phosphatidylserine decarboxylase family protein [Bacteroidales bacterium]
MKIHKEGSTIIILVLGVLCLLNLYLNQIHVNPIVFWSVFAASVVFFLAIVSFFRMPNRQLTQDANALIAPADGEIVVIEDVVENDYLHSDCKQISIFMSPLNVHVNRYPIAGTVLESDHHDGVKLPAFNPKSSTKNERTSILMDTNCGKILCRQIAGAVARRIVCYAEAGSQVEQNQELGFIKFGSRVDLFIPKDLKIEVSMNQKVRGGQTVIARK